MRRVLPPTAIQPPSLPSLGEQGLLDSALAVPTQVRIFVIGPGRGPRPARPGAQGRKQVLLKTASLPFRGQWRLTGHAPPGCARCRPPTRGRRPRGRGGAIRWKAWDGMDGCMDGVWMAMGQTGGGGGGAGKEPGLVAYLRTYLRARARSPARPRTCLMRT